MARCSASRRLREEWSAPTVEPEGQATPPRHGGRNAYMVGRRNKGDAAPKGLKVRRPVGGRGRAPSMVLHADFTEPVN